MYYIVKWRILARIVFDWIVRVCVWGFIYVAFGVLVMRLDFSIKDAQGGDDVDCLPGEKKNICTTNDVRAL